MKNRVSSILILALLAAILVPAIGIGHANLENIPDHVDNMVNEIVVCEIIGMDANDESKPSIEATSPPAAMEPTAPQSLSAIAGNSQLNLTWSVPATDGGSAIINYTIYRSTTPGTESFLMKIGNVLTYIDTGLTNGHTYYYEVSASNSIGEGAKSDEVLGTPATVPAAPSGLHAVPRNSAVDLTWNASSSDGGSVVIGYRIYRGTTSNEETLLTTVGNVLTYADSGLTNGQIYYYKVSAVNVMGDGPPSSEASAIPATVPASPTITAATPGNEMVVLVWVAPSSNGGLPITGYVIYRGATSGGETMLTTIGNVLTYTDNAVNNGQIYYYKVSAVSSAGESPMSNEFSSTPAGFPSAPPLTSATSGNGQVELSWSTPASNGGSAITNYRVYRGSTSGGEMPLTTIGNSHIYTDTSVINGQTYYYKVSAINSIGEGAQSNELSATPSTVPSAPLGLLAAAGDAEITLTWSAPASNGGALITSYKVYRGTTSNGETLLATLGNVLSFRNTGLTNGQTYYYRVGAINSNGEGLWSSETFAKPATTPSAPVLISAAPGNAQATLTWAAPSNNGGGTIIGYKVYRGTTAGGENLLVSLGNVLTYTNTGLTNGQTYYYRVSAMNSVGEGAKSNELSVKPITVPTSPTLGSAVPGNTQVVLTWTAPSNGGTAITGYKVYRSTTPGGETFLVALSNILTFVDNSLTNGQTYYYRVSAVNSVGEGPQSNELNAMPIGPPTAPRSLQASPGNAFIYLSWQAPSSNGGSAITNYQVWRGAASGTESFLANVGLKLWYNNTGLTNGQTYYYKVRAENAQGLGPSSSEAFAKPSQTTTVPSAPQSLAATAGSAQITLTWSVPSNNGGAPISNYRVFRGTSSGAMTLITTLGNVLTFTDTGLTNGHAYFYAVSAVNGVGEGPRSSEVSATPATVPTAPLFSSATPGNGQVNLAWMAPSSDGGASITNYEIFRGATFGNETLLVTLGNVLTFTDTGLTNGQIYYYYIIAVNSVGESRISNERDATPVGPPSAPQNLQVAPGNSFVNLTWQAPSSDGGSPIISYHVWRGSSSGAETYYASAGPKLWFNDTGLTNGLTYYYFVQAENAQGTGLNSIKAFATPSQEGSPPSAPQDLVAEIGAGKVSLFWSAPASDGGVPITNYNVYRGAAPGGETLLASSSTVLTYVDGGLINGQTYYYRISAVNSAGESSLSNEAMATPATVPTAPRGLQAVAGNAKIELNWTAPFYSGPGTIIYHLFRDGSLIWNGTSTTFLDSPLAQNVLYSYRVAAENTIGWGLICPAVDATPVSGDEPTTPWTPVAIAGFVAIGALPVITLAFKIAYRRRK